MKIKNRAVLKLIMAGLIALLAISGTSVFAKNLELSDYMYWETAGSPQISPDGSSIIYTRTHADIMTDDWVSELWMMNADGKRNRFLTKGGGVNWAPDGERIAYVGGAGDKQLCPELGLKRTKSARLRISRLKCRVYTTL